MTRRYAQWPGDRRGRPEDPARCVVATAPKPGDFLRYQCRRPRGNGPDGRYCRQHAKKRETITGGRK